MRFLHYGKDGGPESTVWGLFLIEIKSLFSVVLLRFEDGSREAYHSHAFDAVSWVLRGYLTERLLSGSTRTYRTSWRPILTRRSTFHQVRSWGTTWVLSFRGPWADRWSESIGGRLVRLTHGRRVVT